MPIEAVLRLARALRGGDAEAQPTPVSEALRDPLLGDKEELARALEFRKSVMYPEHGNQPIDKRASWYSAAGYTPQDIRGGMRGMVTSPTAIAKATDMAMGMGPGATVYHGSPHRFDKFDMSKIGTGEGAQAYGHGLYFAEDPSVARYYSEKLGKVSVPVETKYRAFDAMQSPNVNERGAGAILAQFDGDFSKAKDFAKSDPAMVDILNKWQSESAAVVKKQKNLYSVDLPDEHIARMLDWDKPLSQQPESVQQGIKNLWQESRVYGDPSKLTGEGIHGSLTAHHLGVGMEKGAGKDAVAKDLRHYGIPGIRYLDQGSRAGGKGTSNYVVFDDKMARILEVLREK